MEADMRRIGWYDLYWGLEGQCALRRDESRAVQVTTVGYPSEADVSCLD